MTSPNQPLFEVSVAVVLRAYSLGIFPMAESADSAELHWIDPDYRGTLPLNDIQLPKRLARTIRQERFDVRVDHDFAAVIDNCAAARPDRQSTWISGRIRELYGELFDRGYCHTIETYRDGRLVGGLYGVALQGAFFGESMFSTETDASKVALMYLCARLIRGGFVLLDTQFLTSHLAQFGTREISRAQFQQQLGHALQKVANFDALPHDATPAEIIDLIRAAGATNEGGTKSPTR